jgi:hypothetical protein
MRLSPQALAVLKATPASCDSIFPSRNRGHLEGSGEVSQGTEGKMKTDEQYVAEFEALFEKHLTLKDQQVRDVFKAENGSLKEDDVVRLFNKWITKRKTPRD